LPDGQDFFPSVRIHYFNQRWTVLFLAVICYEIYGAKYLRIWFCSTMGTEESSVEEFSSEEESVFLQGMDLEE
jgi:hypothetical protein